MKKENDRLEDENSNDKIDSDYDISDQLSLLGKQVSEFMDEAEQLKADPLNPSETAVTIENTIEMKDTSMGSDSEDITKSETSKPNGEDEIKTESTENDKQNDPDFLEQEIAAVQEGEAESDDPEEELHRKGEDTFNPEEPELEEINDSLAEQISSAIDEDAAFQQHMLKKKKRTKRIIIGASIAAVIIIVVCILLGTKAGQKAIIQTAAPVIYDGIFDYDEQATTTPPLIENDMLNQEGQDPTVVKEEDNVINILLVGVEEIEYAQNTDVMIIASLNRDTHELSIISLMRDLYVQIPGHDNNKLNAAYSLGGIDLLYQTINQNFGVDLDGYILVNFETFETIVNLLGGVNVTLTQDEASYLNRTNYISNPIYRTVVAGTQTMNGNQALGYCRIRYVSTGKEINDFGRTARHRAVLNAMFDKLKNKNVFDLLSFMNQVFENVQLKTDISKTKFSDYLTEVVDLNIGTLQQYRIPADDGYTDDKVYIGKNKQWVLLPKDWQETRDLLHEYIYGKDAENETTSSDTSTDTGVSQ